MDTADEVVIFQTFLLAKNFEIKRSDVPTHPPLSWTNLVNWFTTMNSKVITTLAAPKMHHDTSTIFFIKLEGFRTFVSLTKIQVQRRSSLEYEIKPWWAGLEPWSNSRCFWLYLRRGILCSSHDSQWPIGSCESFQAVYTDLELGLNR